MHSHSISGSQVPLVIGRASLDQLTWKYQAWHEGSLIGKESFWEFINNLQTLILHISPFLSLPGEQTYHCEID